MEAQLIRELGLPCLATLGGSTSKLAAMKAKLLGRKSGSCERKRFALFDSLEDVKAILSAVGEEKVVGVRCSREAAVSLWPSVAERCRSTILGSEEGAAVGENAHVGLGSLVACSGESAWCLGGFSKQLDCQRCGAAIVSEAKRRSGAGRRDFFVARPRPVFGDDEKAMRLRHLFGSVPGCESMEVDEEAAYSASNETCAAKVARIASSLGPRLVVDATAGVGGNAIAFAAHFPEVVAVEIDGKKVEMLERNVAHVRASGRALGSVRVLLGDCGVRVASLLDSEEVDAARTLVFADPPWGGRRYETETSSGARAGPWASTARRQEQVHLKGGGDLASFVALVARKRVPHLVLKVPHTLDARALARDVGAAVASFKAHALTDKVQIVVLHLRPPPATQATRKRRPPSEETRASRGSRPPEDDDEAACFRDLAALAASKKDEPPPKKKRTKARKKRRDHTPRSSERPL